MKFLDLVIIEKVLALGDQAEPADLAEAMDVIERERAILTERSKRTKRNFERARKRKQVFAG